MGRFAGWWLVLLFCLLLHTVTEAGTIRINNRFLYPSGAVLVSTERLAQSEEQIMALTFDDGPEDRDHAIAAVLKQYDVPASFFFIGSRLSGRTALVQQLLDAGHEVGLHGYQHRMLAWMSSASQEEDFRLGVAAMNRVGTKPHWFRPPYGSFNATTLRMAQSMGLETILWTIDPRDWTAISAATIARRVIEQFHTGGVILLHSHRPESLVALPEIITAAQAKGYRFVTLSQWRQIVVAANCRIEKQHCPSLPEPEEIKSPTTLVH
ncbi:MAG: polysaccharide deacetylase family protein [Magnetococcales bacterium]|nr:polysaccharide deacetylase family protein [Magnetococcales bacterium]